MMIEYAVRERVELRTIPEEENTDIPDAPIQPHSTEGHAEQAIYDKIPLTTDTVHDYLRNITQYPLLDANQEVELSKTIEAGLYARYKLTNEEALDPVYANELTELVRLGREARLTMIASNSRLVVSIAKRFMRSSMEFSDIIQEGNIGLHRAVDKFDYAKGFKFSTYATWWVRQAIMRGIADQSRTIRLPINVTDEVNRLNKTREAMERLGSVATPELIALELDMPLKRVHDLIRFNKDPVSFDLPIETGNTKFLDSAGDAFGDIIADKRPGPEEQADTTLLHDALKEKLDSIDPRVREILAHRYGLYGGEPASLHDIGKMIGVSRERVRQLEKRALQELASDESLRGLAAAYLGLSKLSPKIEP